MEQAQQTKLALENKVEPRSQRGRGPWQLGRATGQPTKEAQNNQNERDNTSQRGWGCGWDWDPNQIGRYGKTQIHAMFARNLAIVL